MTKDFFYTGFLSPNTTPVPDDVFDVIAPELTEAELRVLMYVIRRTFGFNRERDAISLSQMVDGIRTRDGRILDRGTGMSRRGVMKGCAGLVEKGIVTVEKRLAEQGDNEINIYSLRFREEPTGTTIRGVGNEVPYRRERSAPGVGNEVAPQETGIQETDFDHSNIRKSTRSFYKRNDQTVSERNGLEDKPTSAEVAEPPRLPRDIEPIGAILKRSVDLPEPVHSRLPKNGVPSRRGKARRLPNLDPETYEAVTGVIQDYTRKLGDSTHLKSNVTQAVNLIVASGCDFNTFYMHVIDAYKITSQRNGLENRSKYFFTVLRDRLLPSDTVGNQVP